MRTNPQHPDHPKRKWHCPECGSDFTQARIMGDDYICMWFRHIFTYGDVKYQLSPIMKFYYELFDYVKDCRKSSRQDEFANAANVAAYIEKEMKRLFDELDLKKCATEQLQYEEMKPLLEADKPSWNACYHNESKHPINKVRDIMNGIKRCDCCGREL